MLKISRSFVTQVHEADDAAALCEVVQKAIELEHSTIPPYLTAMISLHPGKNREIWGIIHSVVIEEMLHMSIAANVLNALGGTPLINVPGFIPEFPGPLPMGIGDGLVVGLERYSTTVVENVFMEIEEPEDPINFPDAALESMGLPDFGTIGEFYQALQKKITDLPCGDTLPGDPSRQVTDEKLFPAEQLFPILTKSDAVRALEIIIDQGEGTPDSPLDPEGDLAHYYRFQELVKGRRLIRDTNVPEGYSFSGESIPFDSGAVYPLKANTKSADLPENSEQRRQADLFNFTYGKLLNALHRTFNGEPDFLQSTLGLMFDLKLIGETMAAMKLSDGASENVGPPFEYVDVNA